MVLIPFNHAQPIYNPAEHWLRKMIESVQAQLYPHWQLCLADDVPPYPHVRKTLDEYVAADSRILVTYRKNQVGGIDEGDITPF